MKKLILALLFLPIIFCACQEVKYSQIQPQFGWETFVWHNLYGSGGSGERRWKYGYEKNERGDVLPKAPPNLEIPKYLLRHRLFAGEVNCDNIKGRQYTKKDAVDFVRFNYEDWYDVNDFRWHGTSAPVWGITRDGIYFQVFNTSDTGSPFTDLVVSVIRTIQVHCELENREPTISEKYYVLFYCSINTVRFDGSYCALNHNRLEATHFAELIFGALKLFIICGFVLFCMALPAIVILLLKRVTPEGSIIHKASSIVEWLIILVGGATLVKSITKK